MATEVRPSPPPYSRNAPEKILLSAFDQTMRKVHNHCANNSGHSSTIIPNDLGQASETTIKAYHSNVRNHWIQFIKDSGYYNENEANSDNLPPAIKSYQIQAAEQNLAINIGKQHNIKANSILDVLAKLIHSIQEIYNALCGKQELISKEL